MTLEDLLLRLVPALESAEVPYMLTGSVASSAHGMPRSTRDLDIVIAPTRAQLIALMAQFPGSHYYADEQQALEALANRSQFNVIDFASGWKVDFIIAEDSEHGRSAMLRRKQIELAGNAVYVASAEDVIIAKLRWAKQGGSDRQLQDVAGIASTQGSNLDLAYVERWVREFSLQQQWQAAREICR
ncbi:MAG TPA: hypothetical protein VED66_04345 [Candidatus Sulfotelmatobacter sp.]|nr:hypothetical protein [Candidatus Sulfotelmatobacter sp.]